MQIYLLATNLFALAALLLGLIGFSKETRYVRLLPLFLLVISRSLALIIALTAREHDRSTLIIDTLAVFSTFCVVWVLIGPTSHLSLLWQKLLWLGGAGAVFFSILPLAPIWPVPPQLHSLVIATCGAPLILITSGETRWPHLATPVIVALSDFFYLLDLVSLSWLVSLLAYVVLIAAIHWEGVQTYRDSVQSYKDRQKEAETLAQEAINISRERQRLLEVSEMISAVPDPNYSMEHVVRSMAKVAHVDQSALFMLDIESMDLARLITVYSPERPFHISNRDQITFALINCFPLQQAIEGQRALLLPQPNVNGLNTLYSLWNEDRSGPTLIQPLTVHGRPVGALMLGNPVTHRPIRENDVRLCHSLAPQIAAMVEHRRRYLELELQAEAVAATMQKQLAETAQEAAGETVSAKPVAELAEYRAILESISDGVVVSGITGRVQLVNKAAERILGKPGQKLIGQPIGTIYGEIDASEPIEDLMVAFSRRNQALPTYIETEDQVIQGRLVPWRSDENEWMGIIAVFRDVTREVKADRARNDFIAALSHELRAPLTAVKGYSELITNGSMGHYTSEQIHLQQIIHSSAERMAEVLDNAIQISAQNKRQVLPRFEETDVTAVIDEALHEISPLAQLRELKLVKDVSGELPTIAADRRHLRRILDNLLSNACRFTPPGGRVAVRAWVQSSERAGDVVRPQLILAVADNGIGIPTEEFNRIFDSFYQIKNPSLADEVGMGMGLAVVRELVELHNGRVWVESVVGKGSTFQVALPITQDY